MCKQKIDAFVIRIQLMAAVEGEQADVVFRSLRGKEGFQPFKFCLGAVGAEKLVLIACVKADITRCDECGDFCLQKVLALFFHVQSVKLLYLMASTNEQDAYADLIRGSAAAVIVVKKPP